MLTLVVSFILLFSLLRGFLQGMLYKRLQLVIPLDHSRIPSHPVPWTNEAHSPRSGRMMHTMSYQAGDRKFRLSKDPFKVRQSFPRSQDADILGEHKTALCDYNSVATEVIQETKREQAVTRLAVVLASGFFLFFSFLFSLLCRQRMA